MRIVEVTGPYLPDMGGVQNYIQQIGSRLVERGHSVTVLVHRTRDDSPDAETIDGVQIRRFQSRRAQEHLYSMPMHRALNDEARRADVVHVHNLITFFAMGASRIKGTPVLLTPHYHGMPGREGNLPARYRLPLSYGYKRFASIIFASDAERARVVADLGPVRCPATVISPAVHADIATTPARPTDRPFVLSVGRLVPHKRVDLLIRAVHLADPMELVIIGNGPDRPMLEQLILELGASDRIRFESAPLDSDLWSWMRAATTIASLSTEEAFGMVLAEGVAAGCSVVATNLPAHAEATSSCPAESLHWVDATAGSDQVAAVLRVAMAAGRSPEGRRLPNWDEAAVATEEWYAHIVKLREEGRS